MKTIFLNLNFWARGGVSKMTNILVQKSQYLENKNFPDIGTSFNRFPVKFALEKVWFKKFYRRAQAVIKIYLICGPCPYMAARQLKKCFKKNFFSRYHVFCNFYKASFSF